MKRAVLAAALAAVATWAPAQQNESAPVPGAPRPLQIATPQEDRLDNGLRVIVAERHGTPLVSLRLVVRTGAEADPPQRAGLASMTAGLLARGTRRHGAPALAVAAETLGGSIDSGAGWDASAVGITVTTPRAAEALSLVAEVATQPTFAPAEIERYRLQALDGMKVSYAEPGTLSGLLAMRAVFGDGAYAHPADGTPASLPRIARADLQGFHGRFYRPDNAVLVFAGDIDLAQAMKLARRHFGAWKAPAQPLPKAVPAAGTPWPAPAIVVDVPGAGQAGVSVTLPAIAAGSPERYAGMVANAVLGVGYSARLNQEIRIKRGLSYGAGSNLDARREAGALRAVVQTKNESAAEVVGLVNEQLDGLAAAPVPAPELAARKAYLTGSFGRRLETTQGLGQAVAGLAVADLPLAELSQRIAQLQAVDASQVQAFAAKYFDKARRHVVIAGESAAFSQALKAAGPMVSLPQGDADLESAAPPQPR